MKKYRKLISAVALRSILVCLFLMMALEPYAQAPSGVLNESERGYFVTLTALMEYLKQEPTPMEFNHKGGSDKENVAFYDQVIDQFFERKAILKEVESDTTVDGLKRRFDGLVQTLHYFDRSLDTVRLASVLIEPFRFPSPSKDGEVHNALNIRLKKGHQKLNVLTFYFNEKTNKIIDIGTSYE